MGLPRQARVPCPGKPSIEVQLALPTAIHDIDFERLTLYVS